MTNLIKKPHEIDVQTKIKVLIYGQAGMGKSTLALSAPKPLMIDCDGGVHRVNVDHRCDTVQVESYADCLALLKENLSAYESIIIDTGGKLLDYMGAYIIERNPKMGKANGSLTLQGYGERKMEFSQFCKQVGMLNKHLIFVAHRETRTEGDNTRYVPLFGGSNYDSLVTELDLVGYLEANGRKRMITFDGTDRNDGKNTCNLPSMMELPNVVDGEGNGLVNAFLTESVINPYLANLEKAKQKGEKFRELMAEIIDNIAVITDEVSANDFIDRIDSFEHIGASRMQAGILLSKKAKELKMKLNQQTKRYEKG